MIVLMNFFNYNRRHRNSAQNQNQKTKPDFGPSPRALNPFFSLSNRNTGLIFSN